MDPRYVAGAVFRSSIPFVTDRVRAAAVSCSDGRFGDQVDELLHVGLGLPRYDRVALPGGPACMAGRFMTYQESDALVAQLRFLVTSHRLERLVLIAHEHCGFYLHRLHISPEQLEREQHDDLHKACARLRSLFDCQSVEAFFARRCDQGTIRFERVE
jgi:hypothetical protein